MILVSTLPLTANAINTINLDGIISGWTIYDDFGRPIAKYNVDGKLEEVYRYNKYGFLYQTIAFFNPVTGIPAKIVSNMDDIGRKGSNYLDSEQGPLISKYLYKSNGCLGQIKNYLDIITYEPINSRSIVDNVGRCRKDVDPSGKVFREYQWDAMGLREVRTYEISKSGKRILLSKVFRKYNEKKRLVMETKYFRPKLALYSTQRSVKPGKAATIRGQLYKYRKSKVAKRVIKILANGKVIARIRTNTKGSFVIKHRPQKTTKYQAVFAGNRTYRAVSSKLVSISVKK